MQNSEGLAQLQRLGEKAIESGGQVKRFVE